MESWRRRWLLEKERFPEHGQDGSEQPSPSTAGTLAFICQSWFCSHGYATWRACYQPFICGNTVEYMMFQIKICGLRPHKSTSISKLATPPCHYSSILSFASEFSSTILSIDVALASSILSVNVAFASSILSIVLVCASACISSVAM